MMMMMINIAQHPSIPLAPHPHHDHLQYPLLSILKSSPFGVITLIVNICLLGEGLAENCTITGD